MRHWQDRVSTAFKRFCVIVTYLHWFPWFPFLDFLCLVVLAEFYWLTFPLACFVLHCKFKMASSYFLLVCVLHLCLCKNILLKEQIAVLFIKLVRRHLYLFKLLMATFIFCIQSMCEMKSVRLKQGYMHNHVNDVKDVKICIAITIVVTVETGGVAVLKQTFIF